MLRKMIFPIIIIVLLFFVAMIVLEWGLGLSRQQQAIDKNLAGEINGEQISWNEYNQVFQNLYQREAQKSDKELPDSKVKELRLEAWKQLVNQRLIQQQIKKYDIVVTDEEVYEYLRRYPPQELQQLPAFQTNGQFDYQKYFNAMADPQATSFWKTQVEPLARENLAMYKVQELVTLEAHVTEPEVKAWFLGATEKVKVGMVDVAFKRFSTPTPPVTEEEMKEYFNSHKDKYSINERVSLNLVMVEKKPLPSDWEAAYQKAKAIYDSLKAGADFTQMVERYSDDPSSVENKGDLGWFGRGEMVDEFDKYVFQMKKGQLSEPIRTQFGWHIIKLHDIKEEMEKPRGKQKKEKVKKVHASHILIKVSPSQETLDSYYRKIEEFRTKAEKVGFFKAAEDMKIPVRSTGYFFRGRNIQYLGNDPKAGLFAFNNNIDDISDIFENNSAFYVVQVADKKPEGLATFEEAKDRVELDLKKSKVMDICRDTASAIIADVHKGLSLKKAAKKHGEEYETPDPFTRSGYVPGIRRDPMAIGAAFALKEVGQVSDTVEHAQGVVIFELLERITPDMTEYQAKHDSVYNVVLMNKRQELYSRWMDYMLKNSKIESYIENFFAQEESNY